MAMNNDFDRVIPRDGTSNLKYDARHAVFGRQDVIPLWVADMDFAAPGAVQQTLVARAAHPIYGYTQEPESLYDALIHWMDLRHGWTVQRDWVMLCPGVVPSLHATILALTQPGHAVIVQPPVYAPFLAAPEATGRRLLRNPLKFVEGRYRFDLDDLERCAAEGGRVLLLCSPHNPVGRVWQAQELQDLLAVCRRNDITIVSDEIHSDLVYPGTQHVPLARLAHNSTHIITAVAPSKTFNIPGLGLSALISTDAATRSAITRAFDMLHVTATNPFSLAAFEAAYRGGSQWLDELLIYLAGTRDWVRDFIRQQLPKIKLIEPDGTYLLWLDCRELGMNDAQLKRFFVEDAGVGMSPGPLFGEQGNGFMRMNIGAPRSVIEQAMCNIARAVAARGCA